jgi:hypothetical protein
MLFLENPPTLLVEGLFVGKTIGLADDATVGDGVVNV